MQPDVDFIARDQGPVQRDVFGGGVVSVGQDIVAVGEWGPPFLNVVAAGIELFCSAKHPAFSWRDVGHGGSDRPVGRGTCEKFEGG